MNCSNTHGARAMRCCGGLQAAGPHAGNAEQLRVSPSAAAPGSNKPRLARSSAESSAGRGAAEGLGLNTHPGCEPLKRVEGFPLGYSVSYLAAPAGCVLPPRPLQTVL